MKNLYSSSKYFQVFCYLPEIEISDPGVTVSFSGLVDLSEIEKIRQQCAEKNELKPTYTAFLIKAIARAIKEMPYANKRVYRHFLLSILGPRLQSFDQIDITVASEWGQAEVPSAAFVDVLRHAEQKPIDEIVKWLNDLHNFSETENQQWLRFKKIIELLPARFAAFLVTLPQRLPSLWVKYRGGSVLISSPGKYGFDVINGVWAWPLGFSFGYVKKRPIEKNNELVLVPSFYLSMNFDRRVMAGAPAAKFFKFVVDQLQEPKELMS